MKTLISFPPYLLHLSLSLVNCILMEKESEGVPIEYGRIWKEIVNRVRPDSTRFYHILSGTPSLNYTLYFLKDYYFLLSPLISARKYNLEEAIAITHFSLLTTYYYYYLLLTSYLLLLTSPSHFSYAAILINIDLK